MKLRQLTQQLKHATASAWPPQWTSAYAGADLLAVSDEGVLKDVNAGPGARDITWRVRRLSSRNLLIQGLRGPFVLRRHALVPTFGGS